MVDKDGQMDIYLGLDDSGSNMRTTSDASVQSGSPLVPLVKSYQKAVGDLNVKPNTNTKQSCPPTPDLSPRLESEASVRSEVPSLGGLDVPPLPRGQNSATTSRDDLFDAPVTIPNTKVSPKNGDSEVLVRQSTNLIENKAPSELHRCQECSELILSTTHNCKIKPQPSIPARAKPSPDRSDATLPPETCPDCRELTLTNKYCPRTGKLHIPIYASCLDCRQQQVDHRFCPQTGREHTSIRRTDFSCASSTASIGERRDSDVFRSPNNISLLQLCPECKHPFRSTKYCPITGGLHILHCPDCNRPSGYTPYCPATGEPHSKPSPIPAYSDPFELAHYLSNSTITTSPSWQAQVPRPSDSHDDEPPMALGEWVRPRLMTRRTMNDLIGGSMHYNSNSSNLICPDCKCPRYETKFCSETGQNHSRSSQDSNKICPDCKNQLDSFLHCPDTGRPHEVHCTDCRQPLSSSRYCTASGMPHTTRNCSFCRRPFHETRFCPETGQPHHNSRDSSDVCRNCSRPYSTFKFCPETGEPHSTSCPDCHQLRGSSRYCPETGLDHHHNSAPTNTCPDCLRMFSSSAFCINTGRSHRLCQYCLHPLTRTRYCPNTGQEHISTTPSPFYAATPTSTEPGRPLDGIPSLALPEVSAALNDDNNKPQSDSHHNTTSPNCPSCNQSASTAKYCTVTGQEHPRRLSLMCTDCGELSTLSKYCSETGKEHHHRPSDQEERSRRNPPVCPDCKHSYNEFLYCPQTGREHRYVSTSCPDCKQPLETAMEYCPETGRPHSAPPRPPCPDCKQPHSHSKYCPETGIIHATPPSDHNSNTKPSVNGTPKYFTRTSDSRKVSAVMCPDCGRPQTESDYCTETGEPHHNSTTPTASSNPPAKPETNNYLTCPSCKQLLDGTSPYCPETGEEHLPPSAPSTISIPESTGAPTCAQCKQDINKDRFCSKTGKPHKVDNNCPSCLKPVTSAKFCTHTGKEHVVLSAVAVAPLLTN